MLQILYIPTEVVYPITKVSFESYEVNAPYDIGAYLSKMYSALYMQFPGGLHHGSATVRPPLSQWTKLHNIDMNEFLVQLKEIFNKI